MGNESINILFCKHNFSLDSFTVSFLGKCINSSSRRKQDKYLDVTQNRFFWTHTSKLWQGFIQNHTILGNMKLSYYHIINEMTSSTTCSNIQYVAFESFENNFLNEHCHAFLAFLDRCFQNETYWHEWKVINFIA